VVGQQEAGGRLESLTLGLPFSLSTFGPASRDADSEVNCPHCTNVFRSAINSPAKRGRARVQKIDQKFLNSPNRSSHPWQRTGRAEGFQGQSGFSKNLIKAKDPN